jgi:4-hydroxybenzoyl-CoA thioesterase
LSHRFHLDVRFGDLDQAGIVYYPRYLHFCHVGMEEYFLRVVGVGYPAFLTEHDLGLPAVRTEVDHRRPIRYGEAVELEVTVERVGASSVEWRHRFWHLGEARPSTECRVVTVLVAMSTFEKRDVPEWLRQRLRPAAS